MGDDEQLQLQKDTWWEIRQENQRIAYLEEKITDYWEATDEIRTAWDAGKLGVIGGRLIRRRGQHQLAVHLPARMPSDDFMSAVCELEEARNKLSRLKASFDRMIGATKRRE